MTTPDLLVIGGGPAALSAARGYREAGGTGTVTILSDDDAAPYDRPPLSKHYLRGEAEEHELPMESPSFYAAHDLDLRLGTAAVALDPVGRTVALAGGAVLGYRTCVLATGGSPKPLPVPGADDPRVLQLRSVASARTLRAAAAGASTAVVIGSGFIGCEAAASLARRGVRVTQVSSAEVPQAARLGADAGRRIEGWLRADGVSLRGGVPVTAVEGGTRVVLEDGTAVDADLVLMASGVAPRVELAEAAGLAVEQGRLPVDQHMRTAVDGLLAAGDVARAHNAAAGRHLTVEHWGEALAMGGVAGATAAGADASWAQAPGFWSEIGDHVLKHVAWGDGFDEARFVEHGDGFTVWYGRDGVTVGVLTCEADDDSERGRELVESGAPLP